MTCFRNIISSSSERTNTRMLPVLLLLLQPPSPPRPPSTAATRNLLTTMVKMSPMFAALQPSLSTTSAVVAASRTRRSAQSTSHECAVLHGSKRGWSWVLASARIGTGKPMGDLDQGVSGTHLVACRDLLRAEGTVLFRVVHGIVRGKAPLPKGLILNEVPLCRYALGLESEA